MSKVEILSHHRAHYTIRTDNGDVHVLPASIIDDVINNKQDWAEIEDYDLMLRAIFKDWRDFIMNEAGI